MDSLRIWNRRTCFRYSESVGGDAIAFLRHFKGECFTEAIDFLLAQNGSGRDPPSPPPIWRTRPSPSQERPMSVLPPSNNNNKRVYAYLQERGIAHGIIGGFIDMGLLYEDAEHIRRA